MTPTVFARFPNRPRRTSKKENSNPSTYSADNFSAKTKREVRRTKKRSVVLTTDGMLFFGLGSFSSSKEDQCCRDNGQEQQEKNRSNTDSNNHWHFVRFYKSLLSNILSLEDRSHLLPRPPSLFPSFKALAEAKKNEIVMIGRRSKDTHAGR